MEETRVLQWEDRLAAILLPAMQHAIEQHGPDASGAYSFYASRVAQRKVFLEYETALAGKLLSCGLDFGCIHEIGCGYGQLVFLLGWNGFQVLGFEGDRQRAQTAQRLRRILSLVDPALTRNVTVVPGAFPASRLQLQEVDGMAVTTNLVVTASPGQQRAVVAAMRRYRYSLIDVQRFFELRMETAREHEVMALFAEAGFPPPQLFLDLGLGGRYYLFEGEPIGVAATPMAAVGLSYGLCA